MLEVNLSDLKQVALIERFILDSKVLSVVNKTTEELEDELVLTIECDMTKQGKREIIPEAETVVADTLTN